MRWEFFPLSRYFGHELAHLCFIAVVEYQATAFNSEPGR